MWAEPGVEIVFGVLILNCPARDGEMWRVTLAANKVTLVLIVSPKRC